MKRDPSFVPLSHDHHHALSQARKLRRAATADPPAALSQTQAFLQFFDSETSQHFDQEERLVFPILGARHPLVQRALADHPTIRSLVGDLRNMPDPSLVAPARLVQLADALTAHIRFEERVLFEAIQREAEPSALARVARELEAWHPAPGGRS